MPRRPDNLETLRLTLELLRRIPRNRKVAARELHQQLADAGMKRDLRSIQRQLDMLSEHFDIERDNRSKPYGYRWKEHALPFALPTLNVQQSLLLLLAQQHLTNLLPANLTKSMEPFFAQARSNLGPLTNARLEREWLKKVRVVSTSQPLLPPKITPAVFAQVSAALFGNRWLEVEYKNAGNVRIKADVMPLGLAQQGPRLYLVCRFRNYNNERSLALHRIVAARTQSLEFERPRDFDLEKYDDDGRFGFGEGRRIRLSFRIDKLAGQHLLETPLSRDQKVEERDDHYRISATVIDSAQLEWWLRGFGVNVDMIRRARLT
jgi:predicted DNA-binding transcriptional regulator YafY